MAPGPEYKLIVNHMPEDFTESSMRDLFARIHHQVLGPSSFISCNIVRHRSDGRSRSFGFVSYADERDRDLAIQTYDGTPYGPKILKVSKAEDGVRHENVMVKRLPINWTTSDVYNYVGQDRAVITCRIVPDKTDNGFPMAYVRFDRESDALAAIAELNDHKFRDHYGNPVQLSLERTDKTKKRRKSPKSSRSGSDAGSFH